MLEIRRFLGMAVYYYKRFIEGFSKISLPLSRLTQKNAKLCGARSIRVVLRN